MARSVGIAGRSRVMGMLFTEIFQNVPNITLYDRSDRLQAFRDLEVQLAKSGLMRRDHAQRLLRVVRSGPRGCRVLVECSKEGETDVTVVRCSGTRRTFRLNWANVGSWDAVDAHLAQIVRAVKQVV